MKILSLKNVRKEYHTGSLVVPAVEDVSFDLDEGEFVVILGENRYIRVEQSVETEEGESEQEYCYSVYENGKLVERSAFSYETEENETELKMTSFKDGKTQVLYFEREIEKGEEVIEIHVGDGKHGKGYIVHIEKDENGDNRYSFIPTDFDD